ncbi:MAG: 6-bladed beta-propeller [Verrucomicrobia bacterium]|nr:MAG: 6-bladed beta-propeller [Verrucomicrobiota bacterium]
MHHARILLLALFVSISALAQAETLKFSIASGFFDEKPDGKSLGPCHGGAVIDKAGNIYVTTDTERGVVVFSPAGKFLRAVGPTRIHGLEIREENGTEYIYGARPADHEAVKLKLEGERLWAIGFPKEVEFYASKEPKAFQPCALTVAQDGSIFIADGYGSNFILKYDKDRKFVKMFGGTGAEEGKFNTCHGIAVDTRQGKPLLLVCNRNNNRVEYWDLDGNFVKVIQKDLRMPAAVQIRGDYAVFPELKGRVTVLDKEGRIAAQVGDNPNEKQRANFALPPDEWKEGICNSPHGASIDQDGNLIVTEWSKFGRVEKFVLAK